MALTYCIADLHGRHDLLMRSLDAIYRHARRNSPGPNTIITTGDYVDRGPDSAGIIDELMKPAKNNWIRIRLQGNHEAMMVDTYNGKWSMMNWLQNGGGQTLLSYGQSVGDAPDPKTFIPKLHINWIAGLPKIHIDKHRVYVHATVDPSIPLDEQTDHTMQWGLYGPYQGGHGDYHVVHGHEQFAHGPMKYEGRTNLDTGSFYTGRQVVGVFDDNLAGGPIDIIEVFDEK